MMSFFLQGDLPHLITTYGYWAVGTIIALESMGLPLPGETTLIAAAVVAGTTHKLNIYLVIASAATGAIFGDNAGFLIGRELGFWLAVRYGSYIGLTEPRLKLGQYVFLQNGGTILVIGRFVAVLRTMAAFLAGVNCMEWPRFLIFNATGALLWAGMYGFGAWYLGKQISAIAAPAGIAIGVVAVGGGFLFVRQHAEKLQADAEAALPGPLRRRRARYGET